MKNIYNTQANTSATITMIIAALLFFILAVGAGPLITIWSLNTVFGLKIAYTFWTWLGMLFLNTQLFSAFKLGAFKK
tara:strand:- start:138 stop:368 length:231 start_codon:yes stop_codon:yes gene_type:complete